MADIKLKGADGIDVVYNGVNSVTLNNATGGGTTTFKQSNISINVIEESAIAVSVANTITVMIEEEI